MRHPSQSVSAMASGITTSCPADMPPAAIPMATPRRASNHRAATVAAVGVERPPAPSAKKSPMVT